MADGLTTATAKRSLWFTGSLLSLHGGNCSPTAVSQLSWYTWYPRTIASNAGCHTQPTACFDTHNNSLIVCAVAAAASDWVWLTTTLNPRNFVKGQVCCSTTVKHSSCFTLGRLLTCTCLDGVQVGTPQS